MMALGEDRDGIESGPDNRVPDAARGTSAQGGDGDYRHYADYDAESGEKGPHLAVGEILYREFQIFNEYHDATSPSSILMQRGENDPISGSWVTSTRVFPD